MDNKECISTFKQTKESLLIFQIAIIVLPCVLLIMFDNVVFDYYYFGIILLFFWIAIVLIVPKILIDKYLVCPNCGNSTVYWYPLRIYILWRTDAYCKRCGIQLRNID